MNFDHLETRVESLVETAHRVSQYCELGRRGAKFISKRALGGYISKFSRRNTTDYYLTITRGAYLL